MTDDLPDDFIPDGAAVIADRGGYGRDVLWGKADGMKKAEDGIPCPSCQTISHWKHVVPAGCGPVTRRADVRICPHCQNIFQTEADE